MISLSTYDFSRAMTIISIYFTDIYMHMYTHIYTRVFMHRHTCITTMCVLNCVQFSATPWTVACQAPLSMEFSRQEYWNGRPFPPPGYLPDPGIKSMFLAIPALAGKFFTTAPPGKPNIYKYRILCSIKFLKW